MHPLGTFIHKYARRIMAVLGLALLLGVVIFNGYVLADVGCRPLTEAELATLAAQGDADALISPFSGIDTAADAAIIEVSAAAFNQPLTQDEITQRYARPAVLLQANDPLQVDLNIAAAGDYLLVFDMAVPPASPMPEGQITLDGVFPDPALRRVTFPIYYRNATVGFPKDRYGNDALMRQIRNPRWTSYAIEDTNVRQAYPLRLSLTAGAHRLELRLTRGALYLGTLYLVPFAPYPDYQQYRDQHADALPVPDFSLSLEAELPAFKNETSVRPVSSRSLDVTPYHTYCLLLNTLGGDSWINSGSAVYYQIEVPQDGLYAISLHALQDTRSNFTVYRRITINGAVPFAELNAFPFHYAADWQDVHLGGAQPYLLFLRAGRNTLGIEATNTPYLPAIATIQQALREINTLALEIRRLTGNQNDPFREWLISDYIPDIEQRLLAIANQLSADKDTLLAHNPGTTSPESLTYQMAVDNLLFLAQNTNEIPIYMSRFSEGSGSAAQLLGSLLPLLQSQPLALDTITIHSPALQPVTPTAPPATALVEGYKRFVHSFLPDPYLSRRASGDELEVWVNRPRQHVNLLQLMADSSFTPQTGIRVRFSIMPDESKLVLANAANIQPDVALGISTNIPYELAIRNALYDLRQFEDFDSFIRRIAPGSLLGYIIDEAVYAIPETQDFWVTFYREDILNSLGIPIPDTWDDVIAILPELQRYGMNYNTPLSRGGGQKGYLITAPYLFNYGAPLYSADGFTTGLQSDEAIAAIKFMADSFTIYGMPLTVENFYQDFRYGSIPIGIANGETYVKLATIAPEIEGLWGIDLYPATVLPDGSRNRYATGSAQTSLIFRNTDRPDEGWEFLKWWLSTETQVEFQEQLVLNFGREYLWFSANLEAFAQLAIPEEHRAVILEQWQWVQEPVRLPGSYMQERELSNIWNRIVFDGVNPRVAIDRSVIVINREIRRKMEEFGYLKDGQVLREFIVPSIETVTRWMENAD